MCRMMTSSVYVLSLCLSLLPSSLAAVSSIIVPPIRSSGNDVAAIFIPGALLKGEAYLKTATAIQKASQLRLWVALTGNYSFDTPNPLELPHAVDDAIAQLKRAGMKGDNFAGIAHSLGGVFLSAYARQSKLKAIVLLGSYLPRNMSLKDYPVPVMTLSGELDGQVRITRIAVEYEKLLEIITTPGAVYRTPVINIPGVSHAQFSSGPMPPRVTTYGLTPEVTEDQAHLLIGQHVSNFLTVTFDGPTPAAVQSAKTAITHSVTDSGLRFQPLLSVKALDSAPLSMTSPWSVLTQSIIAGDLITRTQIENLIEETETVFVISKPNISKNGSSVTIKTTTYIEYESNPMDISITPESPKSVDIKFKSYEALRAALGLPEQLHSANIACRDLNQLALQMALFHSSPEARRRYETKGRPIIFQDDAVEVTGAGWVDTPLKLVEDDSGLHVQSPALKVSIHSPIYPGNYNCKVLSPYRAMEWVAVDSLRSHKPCNVNRGESTKTLQQIVRAS